jgi:transposase
MNNPTNNPIPLHLRPTTLTKKQRTSMDKAQSARLMDPKLRKLRRQQIVMSKVLGMTNEHIGRVFNLRRSTVAREVNEAKKEGMLESLNERIIEELVPDAIELYKRKMKDEDDAFVAKDVLKHLERLTARKDEKARQEGIQYSMDTYIRSKRELPNGQVVSIEQHVKGEAAKALLEQGNLEAAPASGMSFLEGVVVETVDDKD